MTAHRLGDSMKLSTRQPVNYTKPLHFPLEQQTRCTTPSRPHQQQTSYSKRGNTTPQAETVEHLEQPSHASQHCARTQERACLRPLKTGWLLAFSARPSEMVGTKRERVATLRNSLRPAI
ncbi:hypothetical protein E2C01_059962 [Portunus trituberculatus]|uniref:Uncharacterized protein n=1 Tax=Portunus trituberculatus TaxID=210409 RepID=A0A5B7H812_PORTR|nr:hypothetical protein [Portunus trituberculatus]